ncbi:hypothetical protein ACFFMP_02495 [Pseudoroseomonas cervicalis]|uniref:hypothetical protein n=1 Tax=Teichococcus cervicalis TaxID=204525 RepID=UPI0012F52B41|nr:hypothetical protein [Pseudoroseomonas cervicalis]
MSWTPLLPPARKAPPSPPVRTAAVVISAAAKGATGRDRLIIRVRPHAIEGGLDWWTAGRGVDVHVGHGEHSGWLRIEPGNTYTLRKVGPQAAGRMAMLSVPLPETVEPGKRTTVVAAFEHHPDWIEVELPWSWRLASEESAAVPAVSPQARPASPASYVGISSRIPDPAAQRRAEGRALPNFGAGG